MNQMEKLSGNELKNPSKAPLVLGIISLFAWLIPIAGLIISIVGIVVSYMNLKIEKIKAYRIGLVLNIIGLVITIGYLILSYYVIFNLLTNI